MFYVIGFIMGLVGSILSWGCTALLFTLTAVTAWDRLILCVAPEPGSLCRRLALRQVLAQYQYLKTMMTNVSRGWSTLVIWSQCSFHAVFVFCLVESLFSYHTFSMMITYNVVFCVAAAAAWWIQRMTSGWKGATSRMVGCISQHADRWARGDYNSEADVRLDDFVTLQQALHFACEGSSYPRWVVNVQYCFANLCSGFGNVEEDSSQRMLLNADPLSAEEPEDVGGDSVWGRTWMYVLAVLVVASAALVPVTCIYSWNSLAANA